ncbi:hypothetical protein MC7420_3935 [Coleofasciculus chthonoplastes PCC 7420]|uniref:Uncharacterized protein n=1 Tax=Coleofasciculus chthonoplastes PCC 7420 TaxID=118168 RepID=B4VUT0_9CYAN|nr:hypothetical protein MC7420_3935 [Coleofasciculus chthonoplastes PCC 7420]
MPKDKNSKADIAKHDEPILPIIRICENIITHFDFRFEFEVRRQGDPSLLSGLGVFIDISGSPLQLFIYVGKLFGI